MLKWRAERIIFFLLFLLVGGGGGIWVRQEHRKTNTKCALDDTIVWAPNGLKWRVGTPIKLWLKWEIPIFVTTHILTYHSTQRLTFHRGAAIAISWSFELIFMPCAFHADLFFCANNQNPFSLLLFLALAGMFVSRLAKAAHWTAYERTKNRSDYMKSLPGEFIYAFV